MDNAKKTEIPDWWKRENQKRSVRTLLFFVLVLVLIAYHNWTASLGVIGHVNGIDFDTRGYIAYVREDAKGKTALMSIRADGTDSRSLTPQDSSATVSSPAWTPDGRTILFASSAASGAGAQIFVLGSGQPKQLTYGTGAKSLPMVSPTGGEAGFFSQGSVKTVHLNGTDVRQVLPAPIIANPQSGADELAKTGANFNGPFLSAAFASDGQSIAGVQDISADIATLGSAGVLPGDETVIVVPASTNRPTALEFGREVSFAWEPGGTRIACAYAERDAQLADGKRIQLSGINIHDLTAPPNKEPQLLVGAVGNSVELKNPDWSPDHHALAFEVWRSRGEGQRDLRGIHILDVAKGAFRVTAENADRFRCAIAATPESKPQRPRWSPDGKRLLFESVRPDGKRDLVVVNSDFTNRIVLTKGIVDNYDAAWSPTK